MRFLNDKCPACHPQAGAGQGITGLLCSACLHLVGNRGLLCAGIFNWGTDYKSAPVAG